MKNIQKVDEKEELQKVERSIHLLKFQFKKSGLKKLDSSKCCKNLKFLKNDLIFI